MWLKPITRKSFICILLFYYSQIKLRLLSFLDLSSRTITRLFWKRSVGKEDKKNFISKQIRYKLIATSKIILYFHLRAVFQTKKQDLNDPSNSILESSRSSRDFTFGWADSKEGEGRKGGSDRKHMRTRRKKEREKKRRSFVERCWSRGLGALMGGVH